MKRMLFILLFTACLAPIAWAQKTHEYYLDNGLALIVRENHRAPVVITQVWYKVGSSYEKNGKTGISHLLEHLMFGPTKDFAAGDFAKLIAENGGFENAATSDDFTYYYEQLAADKLALSLKLEASRMRHLVLTQKEFDKDLKVVKEERRLRVDDNPQALTFERFKAGAYLSNPYHHPTVGWMTDLNHLTLADVKAWYKMWYAPNNATVVVVGDVDPKQVYNLVKHYFGDFKSVPVPKRKPHTDQQPLGTRRVDVRLPARLPWIVMGYNVPVINTAQIPWEPYALDVAAAIFSSGNSARLEKVLVRDKTIASTVGAWYDDAGLYARLFTITGTPTKDHTVADLQKGVSEQVQHLQKTLVTERELQRIVTQMVANRIYGRDSLSQQANEIGSLESVNLSWELADKYVKNIRKVTPKQVRAVAQKYLIPERLTVAVLTPEKG